MTSRTPSNRFTIIHLNIFPFLVFSVILIIFFFCHYKKCCYEQLHTWIYAYTYAFRNNKLEGITYNFKSFCGKIEAVGHMGRSWECPLNFMPPTSSHQLTGNSTDFTDVLIFFITSRVMFFISYLFVICKYSLINSLLYSSHAFWWSGEQMFMFSL